MTNPTQKCILCPACQRSNIISQDLNKLHAGEFNSCCRLIAGVITQEGASTSYQTLLNIGIINFTGSVLYNIGMTIPLPHVQLPVRSVDIVR